MRPSLAACRLGRRQFRSRRIERLVLASIVTSGAALFLSGSAIASHGWGRSERAGGRSSPSAQLRRLSASYASIVLADGPAAYWRLGESSGTTATDASGHGFNSTYSNGVSLGASGAIGGDSNTAARFDGVDDRVNGSVVTTQVSNVTLEAWVNWDGTAGSSGEAPMIVYNGYSGQDGYGLMIGVGGGSC